MPRKFFRRVTPSIEFIENRAGLQWIRPYVIKYRLLSLTRTSISRAFFIGLFVAALPPLPIQMIVASAIAVVFRANLPLSAVLVWVSNPLTIGPILLLEWWLGSMFLGLPFTEVNFDLENWWRLAGDIARPLFVGSIAWGLISGFIGYCFIQLIWRMSVISRSRRRKKVAGQKQ